MTGIGLVTRGMVSIPLTVLQRCRAVQEDRCKVVSAKPVIQTPAVARISMSPTQVPLPVSETTPVIKPKVSAVERKAGTVNVSVGVSAAPPAPAAAPTTEQTQKPTVRVKTNGKPKITIKKDG
jgi:hypothetical protein